MVQRMQHLKIVRPIDDQIFRHTFGAIKDAQLKEFVAILKRVIGNLHEPPFVILEVPALQKARRR